MTNSSNDDFADVTRSLAPVTGGFFREVHEAGLANIREREWLVPGQSNLGKAVAWTDGAALNAWQRISRRPIEPTELAKKNQELREWDARLGIQR